LLILLILNTFCCQLSQCSEALLYSLPLFMMENPLAMVFVEDSLTVASMVLTALLPWVPQVLRFCRGRRWPCVFPRASDFPSEAESLRSILQAHPGQEVGPTLLVFSLHWDAYGVCSRSIIVGVFN